MANHVDAIINECIMVFAEPVNERRSEARCSHSLDICLYELAKHHTELLGNHPQWEGLGWFEVEEDGCEYDGHQHPQFLLGEDTTGVLFRLQW